MIKQQLTVANDDQPSIAIITVNYYEKLAVDAMMTNKVTFVRHRPEGKFFNSIRVTFNIKNCFDHSNSQISKCW